MAASAGFIKFDIREVQKAFDDLEPAMQKASVETLNIVGRSADKTMRDFINKVYKIPARSITRLRVIITASRFRNRPVFTIRIQKVARGLWKYGAKKAEGGVTYRVSTQKSVKKAFIGTWRKEDNNKFVFLKDRKKRTYFRVSRATGKLSEHIKRIALYGPAIWTLYRSKKASRILSEVIEKEFELTLNKKFNEQFEKRR